MQSHLKPPEITAVLCALIRGDLDPEEWARFSPSVWPDILRRAEIEGVAPLIWHTAERAPLPDLDPILLQDLAQGYYRAAGRSALQLKELGRILQGLEKADLRALILKGAALALSIYPDPALRPMGDLDFLVPRDSLEPALRTLADLGYEKTERPVTSSLDPVIEREFFLLGGPAQNVGVDLHWNLIAGDADWRTPPLEWFWSQTTPLPYPLEAHPENGFFHRQLSPTASLLYASAHTMLQHGGSARLIWKVDIQRLLSVYERQIDWEELLRQARALRWDAALAAALAWTEENLGASVPEGAIAALSREADPHSVRVVDDLNQTGRSRTRRRIGQLATLNWKARLGVAARLIFPPPAYLKLAYRPHPAWVWPLYYPYRWGDIVKDTLSSALTQFAFRKAK
ncbi:MAG: nucleotidyltransferase family protein [Anaerolineales bacterium]|nr:nucleotidyltransferase family protein [Anaerolineales bacterium]